MNNSCVLKTYRLYHHALHGGLFDVVVGSQDRLPFYIFGNKGYPLFYWFMIPHKKVRQHHLVLKIKEKGFIGQTCIFHNEINIQRSFLKNKPTRNHCPYCVYYLLFPSQFDTG